MSEKQGFFKRLVSGLTKTRDNIVSGMDSIFHTDFQISMKSSMKELEETLIMGDLGVRATMNILDDLRDKVREQHIKEPIECRQLLIDSIKEQMDVGDTAYEFEDRTSVVFVIGVKRGRKDHDHRQAGRKAERPGKESCAGSSRHFPCRCGRAAQRMGEPRGSGYDRRAGGCRSCVSRI